MQVDSWFDRLVYPLRLRYVYRFARPVLIWNIGKVASTSVARSLQDPMGKAAVLTTHFIDADRSKRSAAIKSCLIAPRKRPLDIITLTREPVGRAVSSFFQNFEANTGISPEAFDGDSSELLRLYLSNNQSHYRSLDWFDNNLKTHIDVDVYSSDFDRNKEYSVIEAGDYRVLLLRSEAQDNVKEFAVREFLGLKKFSLINENVGEQKSYSDLYRQFVDEVKLPSAHVEKMLESKYARHFYGEAEIEEVRRRWLAP